MTSQEKDIKTEREEAWVGDAVLALVAREWILEQQKRIDAPMFLQLTSNQFLNSLGRPTAVEAEIGRLFSEGGLAAAKTFFLEKCVPLYVKQAANRQPWSGKKKFA
jgi:hypothetical protein